MSNLQILFQAPVFSLQLLVDGILVGALFALVAYGMALVWGVMGIINVAQGELVMLGGYVTLMLYHAGWSPFLGIPAAAIVLYLVGWALYRIVIWRIVDRDLFISLLATFGLSILIQQLANQAFGANVDVEVSFLAVSGKADLGGGLIWRAQDDRNYYLLRASAVEQNIRLYRVVKGVRYLVKNHNRAIAPSAWHSLRIIQHGCDMQIRYDNEPLFQLCEQTWDQGRVGLWTKADSVTHFDELTVQMSEAR